MPQRKAIVHASRHYRRGWHLGLITDVVLAGNAVAPGLGDAYLAYSGYESQMTDEPEVGQRPDNLQAPLPGDFGAHDRFDRRAYGYSLQWWLNENRGWLAGAAALGLAGMCLGIAGWRQNGTRQLADS